MNTRHVLLASVAFLIFAPAASAGCFDHGVFYGKFASGYTLNDVGATKSTEPVAQGGHTSLCDGDHWSFDGWASAGPQGNTAFEGDGSIFYDNTAGPIKYQFAAQYYALNSTGKSMLDSSDDAAFFYGDFSWPITFGRLTVAPLVRVSQIVGIKLIPDQTLIQPGIRGMFQFNEHWSISGDVRDSINVTNNYWGLRYDSSLAYRIDQANTIQLGFAGNSRVRSVISIGYSYKY